VIADALIVCVGAFSFRAQPRISQNNSLKRRRSEDHPKGDMGRLDSQDRNREAFRKASYDAKPSNGQDDPKTGAARTNRRGRKLTFVTLNDHPANG